MDVKKTSNKGGDEGTTFYLQIYEAQQATNRQHK